MTRRLALGGIVGPAGFVTAWVVAGDRAPGYSPSEDAISRLAAVHATTRPLMTVGFVLFGVGVPLFGLALRAALGGRAWVAALAAGLCTLAVAAFPLDAGADAIHAASAVLGYVALAATPLLAAGPLGHGGRTSAARASTVAGSTSAALLALSLLGPAHGLLQRAGLGATDIWILAMAVALMRGRSDPDGPTGRTSTFGFSAGKGSNG